MFSYNGSPNLGSCSSPAHIEHALDRLLPCGLLRPGHSAPPPPSYAAASKRRTVEDSPATTNIANLEIAGPIAHVLTGANRDNPPERHGHRLDDSSAGCAATSRRRARARARLLGLQGAAERRRARRLLRAGEGPPVRRGARGCA